MGQGYVLLWIQREINWRHPRTLKFEAAPWILIFRLVRLSAFTCTTYASASRYTCVSNAERVTWGHEPLGRTSERVRARPVTRGKIRVLLSAVNKTRPKTGCSVSCWSRPTDSRGFSSSHARAASAPAGTESEREVYCFSARLEIIWQLAHTTHAPFTQSASILRRALWSRLNYQAAESGLGALLTHNILTLAQAHTVLKVGWRKNAFQQNEASTPKELPLSMRGMQIMFTDMHLSTIQAAPSILSLTKEHYYVSSPIHNLAV